MFLNSMSVGHTPESGRINDGCGSLFAAGPDRLWRLSSVTVRPRPTQGSGAGFHKAKAQGLPPRPQLQRLLEILSPSV